MRMLHEILNDLTNYPKHDYRGIRGNRTGRTLGPDSEYLGCKQRFRGAVNDRTGIERASTAITHWQISVVIDGKIIVEAYTKHRLPPEFSNSPPTGADFSAL